jgi:hypothetical protein
MQAHKEHWHRHFLFKDLYDKGLEVVTGVELEPSKSSADLLPAIQAMDNAFDANGKPNYDLHVWMALCRVMINAGDVLFAAIKADVMWNRETQQADSWNFHYDLSGGIAGEIIEDLAKRLPNRSALPWGSFLKLSRFEPSWDDQPSLEDVIQIAQRDIPFATKKMGAVDPNPNAYRAKLEAYPMSVHPRMAQRAVSTIHFVVALYLKETGLTIREQWFPEDSSQGFARYLLSDGIEHYLMDFDGPALAVVLAHLDAFSGRDEEDGAVILDQERPSMLDVLVEENPELPT